MKVNLRYRLSQAWAMGEAKPFSKMSLSAPTVVKHTGQEWGGKLYEFFSNFDRFCSQNLLRVSAN